MNRRAFLSMVGVGALAGCSGRLLGPDLSADEIAVGFRDRVNEVRADRATGHLAVDQTLAESAPYHAEDMLDRDYLGMNSPAGESMADRYQKFDYSCAGSTPPDGGVAVGNANRVRSSEDEVTERKLARTMFQRLLDTPQKKELAFWDFWGTTTGAAVGEDGLGRTVVYLAQYYC